MKKLENENGKKLNSKKKTVVIILIIVLLLLTIIGVALGLTVFNNNWKEANNNYKAAYETANKKNDELSTLISNAEELVYSEKKALDETLKPTLETAISEAKAAKKELPNKPLLTKEINATIEILEQINYEKESNNLKEKYDALDKSIKQYELVDKPTEKYVIAALKKVKSIVNIAAATEENDPNGKLNKQGGYTSQVYFSSKYVDQSKITGKTVIAKGTDAGGSIEVYTTEEDAKKRENYLAGFDGGVLASGSHKVIGTVLIRTSNELTATRQKELEANIVAALIGEEVKEKVAEETKGKNESKTNNQTTKVTQSTKPTVKQPTKPSYYSIVGTYKGPEGTIYFYSNGTLHIDAIELGENIDGEIDKPFKLDGYWTQNGNTVSCQLYDNEGFYWTPQTITVKQNGLSGWWGKDYNKIG